ncbi:MAG TPA: SPOR domain-containing protein [Burkholderiaceae bacterium]
MAFFKFRWPGKDGDAQSAKPEPTRQRPSPQSESVEILRRRARYRLIGAAVLVLVGVVGFPLLFDTQPRPVAVDIPIVIPDRNQAAPLSVPAAPVSEPAAPAVVATAPSSPAPAPAVQAELPKEEIILSEPPQHKPPVTERPVAAAPAHAVPPSAPKKETHTETPSAKPEPKPAARGADAARAEALLEGRSAAATPPAASAVVAEGRFVVQVGAFNDTGKAREVRQKVERAGLKTYAQVVSTKDGERTRVRVGPFSTRAEADKAAARIKGLDLPAAILTL